MIKPVETNNVIDLNKLLIMKKVLFLFVFSTLSFFAMSQTSEKKVEMKDVRKDLKEIKKEKKDRNADLKAGKIADAAKDSKEIKKDKKDVAKDAKDLKKEGVKHPIKRAEKQIRRAK